MKEITIRGKINFIEDILKQYDCTFEAKLTKSGAFDYGNGTCVVVEYGEYPNGKKRQPDYIDTRYETSLEKTIPSFIEWLNEYFKYKFCPHDLKITETIETDLNDES